MHIVNLLINLHVIIVSLNFEFVRVEIYELEVVTFRGVAQLYFIYLFPTQTNRS